MKVIETEIPGVLIIEPAAFEDPRGFFMETYQRERYTDIGITDEFVQDNISFSKEGTLRGLHFQYPTEQAKLVQVMKGEVLDVAVDIRRGSPSFGKWTAETLSDGNRRQIYIPKGFAHGFCVLSEEAVFHYKCSDYYHPQSEAGILWSDENLQIQWPVIEPIVSDKDRKLPRLNEILVENLPSMGS